LMQIDEKYPKRGQKIGEIGQKGPKNTLTHIIGFFRKYVC
jgi:hypothetical protein